MDCNQAQACSDSYTAAQCQLQLKASLVATLDKGDLAAVEAGGTGNLVSAAACLPAVM